VTDIFGKELDFSQGRTLQNNKGIIASNGTFHDEIVSTVRSVLGV
jgi:3'(2'), 5'-bisphosphate nucleotidase